jgi:hypothetical protein
MELSKAIQFKMSGMRSGVSLASFDDAKAQGVAVAKSLGAGKDVLIDKEDIIETAKPDLASVQASIDFIANKLSFYLGLPASWITGEQTTGMGTTGENDTKAIERGLKRYYTAILKPVLEALFKTTVTYKSQDFRQITTALEAMKTFELTSEELLNHDNKKRIIEGLLDIDEEDNVTVIEPTPAPQKLIPAGPVPPGGNA